MEAINDLRAAMTVISFLTFVGIIWWAFTGKNRQRFEEAANLPFTEDDETGAAGASRQR